MLETLLVAVLSWVATGCIAGLVAWGGLRVELRYLRRDLDDHHVRLKRLEGFGDVGQAQESHNVA